MNIDISEMLGRIDERTKNIENNIASHMESFKDHIKEDKEEFKLVKAKQQGTDLRIALWTGGLAMLGLVLKFFI